MLVLRGYRRDMPLVGILLLLRRWTGFYSALSAVKRNVRIVVHDHRVVHIDIPDHGGIHVHDGGVVEEGASTPLSAIKTGAKVSEPVIDAAIEANVWTPVAGIPEIKTVIPTPISGRPQETRLRRFHPGARHPVVSIVVVIGPVAGNPHEALARTNGLLIHRKRRGPEANRNADSHLTERAVGKCQQYNREKQRANCNGSTHSPPCACSSLS